MFQVQTNRGHVGSTWQNWGRPLPTRGEAERAWSNYYSSLDRPHATLGYNSCSRVIEVK